MAFSILEQTSGLITASVKVSSHLINKIYRNSLIAYSHKIKPKGFSQGKTPVSYIEQNFKNTIVEQLKSFVFWYPVISYLYKELRKEKIIISGDPRLKEIKLDTENGAEYIFEFTPIEAFEIDEWKYLPFKSPKRKRYKDLDKQATNFIEEEDKNKQNHSNNSLNVGCWVCFDLCLVDEDQNPVTENIKENLWLKIGYEEASIPFQHVFLGKNLGDKFYSNALCLHEYFNDEIDPCYSFLIEVQDILYNDFFSMDDFKEHFGIKTNKKAHQKIIEVFSFRNDISLRRAIVEEAFNLMFTKFPVRPPEATVLRQQQKILQDLQHNPDYAVYKLQRGFQDKVYKLARKQIREAILIDYLAYKENMEVTHRDTATYLNLTKRPRTKEFLFFRHPIIQANDQEMPISSEVLKQYCLREKMLNFILDQWNKY